MHALRERALSHTPENPNPRFSPFLPVPFVIVHPLLPPQKPLPILLPSMKSAKTTILLRSFRYRGAQNLCPEEAALSSLDDLLVDGLWGVVHDDCAGLVVDLCVDAGVADEVDDPLLALVL